MYTTPVYAPPPTYYAPPPAPAYYPPLSPAPAPQSPMIINLSNNDNSSGSPCPSCTVNTGTIDRKVAGAVTFLCCIFLLLCSGGIACLYPFCTDTYKDTELICVKCQTVKAKIPANCC